MQTFTARWILPASGPPLERGTVTVRGDRIEAVEPHGARAPDVDLGNVALIPGLVNPHTHLDLSGARGQIPPTDPDHFTDWLRGVIVYRRTRTPEQTQTDIRDGLAECLRHGTTLIGDITSGGASWNLVSQAPIRSVLFWEIIGLDADRYHDSCVEYVQKSGLSWDWDDDSPRAIYPGNQYCQWASSPHAPYSVNHESARRTLYMGSFAIHFAESPAELELLCSRTGPFVDFLRELGVWKPDAISANLADFFVCWQEMKYPHGPRLYVHCNYLPPETPIHPTQSIIYCPRTHAAFRHPPHPFRDFMERGVRVALGTDSLASNPDLDILAEARFVYSRYLDFHGESLLKMVTLYGAESLGWANEAGSLEPGKSADMVAVPLPNRDSSDAYDLLFAPDAPDTPRRTMFRGDWRTEPEITSVSPQSRS